MYSNAFIRVCSMTMFVCVSVGAIAQSEVLFENDKPIDVDRYEDIEGSPYYFDDWVVGKLMRNDARIFENVEFNYNGYSKTFEIRNGDKMIELDGLLYLRFDVRAEDNPSEAERIPNDDFAFQRDIHPRFAKEYLAVLYFQPDVILLKKFEVTISKHTVQNVGAAVDFKRFNKKEIFYLKHPLGVDQLRTTKKKSFFTVFEDDRVEQFAKENKLKIDREKDLIKLIEYYGGLITK